MVSRARLTFSTLGAPELPFEELIALAKRFGMRSLELRGLLSHTDTRTLPPLQPDQIQKTKQMLNAAELSLAAIDCSASFHGEQENALAECGFALHAAAHLGVPYIRVFGDRYEGQESIPHIAAGLRAVARRALPLGVTVLLESHGGFDRAERLLPLLSDVDMPNLALLWDVEHTHRAGISPRTFLADMFPYIRHVHLKDARADGSLCLPGDGVLDIPGTVALLEENGYTGLYSLEWERRWKRELPPIGEALARFVSSLS